MLKKVISSLIIGAAIIGTAPMVTDGALGISVTEASVNINVDRSSAWYDQEKQVFGAAVSINGGEYQSRMYKKERNSGGTDIYMRFSADEEWEFIGVYTGGAAGYHFADSDEKMIFIKVANAAAQSAGYDKMF